ncbi:hypothetical protein BD779DRAFT_1515454 [Infundibulicybe gibba]|nr:hypothetical protein BD779DRAFT_1515454 [Infundibulicybe gibba]
MIASRLSLYLVFFLTLAVTIATPIARPGDKRTDALDAEAALNTLKTSTNSILSQMNGLISNGTATGAAMTPLVNDFISAISSAASSLGTLQSAGAPASNEMATLMTDMINVCFRIYLSPNSAY